MRRTSFILSLLFLTILLAGCISVDTTIKLNRDGSGQIIEKIGIGKEMANFASSFSGDEGEGPKPFSKEQFENMAKQYGEGVKFVSMTESEGERMKYFEAVYAFDDINKIGIDQNQGNLVSTPGQQQGSKKKEPVVFTFSRGKDSSTLKIRMPESDADGSDDEKASPSKQEEASPEMEEAGLQMMKMMMQGMHFAIKIDCNGEIVKTNATNVDKSVITLLEMDFDKLMDDNKKLKELNVKQPEGIEEVKEILKDIEGLKFETQEEVTVRFK